MTKEGDIVLPYAHVCGTCRRVFMPVKKTTFEAPDVSDLEAATHLVSTKGKHYVYFGEQVIARRNIWGNWSVPKNDSMPVDPILDTPPLA